MAARHFSFHLLLFATFITAANLHLLSAADIPTPPSTAPPPPSNSPPPSSPKPPRRRHQRSHHRHRPLPPSPTSQTPPPPPPTIPLIPSTPPKRRRHQHHRHSHHRPAPPPPSRASTPPSNNLPPKRRHQQPPPTPQRKTPGRSSQTTPPPIQDNRQNPLRNIIDGLIGSSDFLGWNLGITSTDIPLAATFFVPNKAILNPGRVNISPFLLLYHIVPHRLTFADLQKFPVKTCLSTMLGNKFIVITNNSRTNFTVDNSPILLPDVFSNAAFVMHGVGKLFDLSVYGGDGIILPPPENNSSGQPLSPESDYPREKMPLSPDYPREKMSSAGNKYYPCCNGILMVLLTLGYAQLSKIAVTGFY